MKQLVSYELLVCVIVSSVHAKIKPPDGPGKIFTFKVVLVGPYGWDSSYIWIKVLPHTRYYRGDDKRPW